jgi:hypothetical protein
MATRAEVLRLVDRYRRAVASNDAVELARLARLWTGIERSLDGEMRALAQQIYEARAAGSAITEQLIMRMNVYRQLREDLKGQILRFAHGDATRAITANQRKLATLGMTYSQDMIATLSADIRFRRLPIAMLETYTGMLGDGTPLYRLLSEAYPYSLDGVIKALLEGAARGWTPDAIARDMANRMGIGLTRITRIARTEGMRAFRSSSEDQYRESGVVSGRIRCANKDTACLACLALDGTHLSLDEDLEDHPLGYCFDIPEVAGAEPLDYQTGLEWLDEQNEDKQRSILGDARYELWQDGTKIEDMVTMAHDDTWGDSPQLVSIADLTGE